MPPGPLRKTPTICLEFTKLKFRPFSLETVSETMIKERSYSLTWARPPSHYGPRESKVSDVVTTMVQMEPYTPLSEAPRAVSMSLRL